MHSYIYEAWVPQIPSPNPDILSQKPTELAYNFPLWIYTLSSDTLFRTLLLFFNGQYATVCTFHELKPRETYACTETRDLISFLKGVSVAEAQI